MFVAHRDGSDHVAKCVGNPFELLDSKKFENSMKGLHRVIIGHNRYATQGGVITKNAHPFDMDVLVGAHNGTISNKYRLTNGSNYSVDSEALYNHIATKGLKDAISILDGAWALTWWNREEQSLNFLRNSERPLFTCENTAGDQLFWASEAWMLEVALSRGEITHSKPVSLPVNIHWKITINKDGGFAKEEEEEVKSSYVKYVPQGNAFTGGGNFQDSKSQAKSQATQTTSQTTKSNVASGNGSAVVTDILEKSKEYHAYCGKQNAKLRVLSSGRDANSAIFLSCYDADKPAYNIRLYVHEKDNYQRFIGKEIIGNIQQKYHVGGGIVYFKVEYSTFKFTPEEVIKNNNEEKEADSSQETFPGYRGESLNEASWRRKYGSCTWCNTNIEPNDFHEITADGAFCYACAVDQEIKPFIR